MTTATPTRRVLGVLSLFLAAAGLCHADGETGQRVKVTLVVVLASDQPGPVDERLQGIADEVRKRNPSLKSFKLESMTSESLAVEQAATFAVVDGQSVQVTVKHVPDDADKVGLAITPPRGGEIVYRTVCGKFLPIVTRYQTHEKERLILAVRVMPCKGGK